MGLDKESAVGHLSATGQVNLTRGSDASWAEAFIRLKLSSHRIKDLEMKVPNQLCVFLTRALLSKSKLSRIFLPSFFD